MSPTTPIPSPAGKSFGNPNLLIKLLQYMKEAKRKATQFKCDESLKSSLNNTQQSNFKYLLFVNAIIFYSCALFNPLYVLWSKGDKDSLHRAYAIYITYAFFAFCVELTMLLIMRHKINNKKLYEINVFILIRMMTG